jgi:hypothetical protein
MLLAHDLQCQSHRIKNFKALLGAKIKINAMTKVEVCVEVGPSYGQRFVKDAVFALHVAFPLINIAEVSLKSVKLEGMAGLRIYSVIIGLLIFSSLHAQSVKIGTIDVYGNRKIRADTILRRAQISEGDSISQTILLHRIIENNVREIPGIRLVRTALECCDKNGNYHLFIGVAESDSAILVHRMPPRLRIELPARYRNAHAQFLERLSDAIQLGETDEDWSEGHALMRYPPVRKIQEKYKVWADENFANLRKVLRSSAYDDQRATAAQIIAYHFNKAEVVPELMHAIVDESDEVRSNAIKALAVVAHYSCEHPDKKVNVPYMPFIRLINSVVWADRNQGMLVLTQLTRSREPEILRRLKEVSLPALKEMAIWRSEVHAFPAYVILARMAGIPENEINRRFAKGTNFADEAMKLADSIK